MKKNLVYFILILLPITSVLADTSVPFSPYGMVENVQSYSSNPFYKINGSYNQNSFPTMVYATGPELGSGECLSVVTAMINLYCDTNKNCDGMQLTDIKPIITVQLSNLPGQNYVTSCGGYIDSAFNNYKQKSNNINSRTSFPSATTKFPSAIKNNQINTSVTNTVKTRTDELEKLQIQNGANDFKLTATQMPKTINDVSFTEQVANKTAGYEQWKEVWGTNDNNEDVCLKNCSYQTPHLETIQESYKRQTDEKIAEATMEAEKLKALKFTNYDEWCRKVPVECAKEKEQKAASDKNYLKLTDPDAFCERYPDECPSTQQPVSDTTPVTGTTQTINSLQTKKKFVIKL